MIELVVQDLVHEIEAYTDFCRMREKKDLILKTGSDGPTNREEWLEARRVQIQQRMQRRRRRRFAADRSRQSHTRKSPLSLW